MYENNKGDQTEVPIKPSADNKDKLYIATTGTSTSSRGNAVLEVDDIDGLAVTALGGGSALDGNDNKIKTLSNSFTRTQGQHAWRSVRVHPDGTHQVLIIRSFLILVLCIRRVFDCDCGG